MWPMNKCYRSHIINLKLVTNENIFTEEKALSIVKVSDPDHLNGPIITPREVRSEWFLVEQ